MKFFFLVEQIWSNNNKTKAFVNYGKWWQEKFHFERKELQKLLEKIIEKEIRTKMMENRT